MILLQSGCVHAPSFYYNNTERSWTQQRWDEKNRLGHTEHGDGFTDKMHVKVKSYWSDVLEIRSIFDMWPKVQFWDVKACYPKSILVLDHMQELHSSNRFQIPERLRAVAWINFNSCILTRFISTVTKIVLMKSVTELTDQLHVLDSFIHKKATTPQRPQPCWCKTESSSGVEKKWCWILWLFRLSPTINS